MPWVGREDNLPVSEMGLPEELVARLTEYNVNCWDELVGMTIKEIADLGFTPEEVTLISTAVDNHTQRG